MAARNMDEDRLFQDFEKVWPKEPDKAIQLLVNFLRVHPGSVRARFRLAGLYEASYGEGVGAAIRIYREILTENAANVACLTALALLRECPQYHLPIKERINLLARAAELSNDPVAIRNLAYKAWEFGFTEEALESFQRVKAAASALGRHHLLRPADQCIAEIKSGQGHPNSPIYSIPEAWLV